MARKRKTKSADATSDRTPSPYRWLLWAIGAGLWLLLAAALFSYDPADPPSHYVYPTHAQPHNWVGKVGAVVAYKLYLVLGPGVWIAQAAALALLIVTAAGRRVDQLILRTVGVTMLCATTSAIIGLAGVQMLTGAPRPEGGGGLLAIFIVNELAERFGTLGSLIVLVVGFWIGAILAIDRLVISLTCRLGSMFKSIKRINIPKPVLVGRLRLRTAGGVLIPERTDQIPIRSGGRRIAADDVDEPIDEDAGGLGGTESFDPGDTRPVASFDDEIDDDDDVDDAGEHDAPGAYVDDEKQPFDPEALREKIRMMPINFAQPTKGKFPAGASLAGIGEPDLSGYRFPSLDLIDDPESNFTEQMEQAVRDQAVVLESAMQQYHIEGSVVGIDSGPVITLYEVRLAPGTKVSRVSAISSDLARAMKAQTIRIVPNIAGKDTIGIEVPNIKKEKVRLKELMIAGNTAISKMKLPMFLGKDASGNSLSPTSTPCPTCSSQAPPARARASA